MLMSTRVNNMFVSKTIFNEYQEVFAYHNLSPNVSHNGYPSFSIINQTTNPAIKVSLLKIVYAGRDHPKRSRQCC